MKNFYLGSLPGNTILRYTSGQYNANRIGLYLDSVQSIKTNITWINPGLDSLKVQKDTDTEMIVSFYSESMYENTSFLYDICFRPDKKALLFITYPYGMSKPHSIYGAVYYYKHTYYMHKLNLKPDFESIRVVNIMDL